MMVVNRSNKKITESVFSDIGSFLKPGDVLVFNKSKVFPARIFGKTTKGKKVEVLFLKETSPGNWEILIGGRVKNDEEVNFGHHFRGKVKKGEEITLETGKSQEEVFFFLEKYGTVPLPPYIKRRATVLDKTDYQNIFAKSVGSAAAPTAGMHFTKDLLANLKKSEVQIEYVTLHVGLGTFAPIRADKVEEHQIHEEYFEVDQQTKERILEAKSKGRRIIACGTTSLRVLESLNGDLDAERGITNIFIYPGYKFKLVDGLITNFHTPRSSLLALVWAFGGKRLMKRAYQLAIKKKYRFFSYGDGMMII
jgi:S-adenosylmethionine:tRNA ribosyltransferase-isomerase